MRIIEDEDAYEVMIDDKRIEGFIHGDKCDKCTNNLIYYNKYDAFFCAYCNQWEEDNCGDANCEFCYNRPETPL